MVEKMIFKINKKKFSFLIKKLYIFLLILFSIIIFEKDIINNYKMPNISIFLPIFNKHFFLKRSIGNIQNQSLKNLEIIAINDWSTDNSLKILKNLAKKDKRIKILNNDRNHGLLYSRAMGILNCTGEYVLNLDPDDMFSNMYNLEMLYTMAKKNNTDLIIFKLKKIKLYKFNISKLNKIIKKFKLNKIKSKSGIINNNKLITNKFIKRKIILKVYNLFKIRIYRNKWNYHEDNIWSQLISKYSKSKILLNKYIYLYLLNKESLMNRLGNILEIKNKIYKAEMLQLIYKNEIFIFKKLLYYLNKYKNIIKKDVETKKKLINIIVNFIVYYKINKSTNLIY